MVRTWSSSASSRARDSQKSWRAGGSPRASFGAQATSIRRNPFQSCSRSGWGQYWSVRATARGMSRRESAGVKAGLCGSSEKERDSVSPDQFVQHVQDGCKHAMR